MKPTLRFLNEQLIVNILDEAREILRTLGMTVNNREVLSLLGDHGAKVDLTTEQVRLTDEIIDSALKTSPASFQLYDVMGTQTHDFSGDNVHYTPGSSAINVLDQKTGKARRATTADYIRYAKLLGGLEHIASQSTAFVPGDVADGIADSYRLFLSLLFCEKPVITGAFSKDFDVIRDLQNIVRGGADQLKQKPLTVISCCPTAPLKWSEATSQNLLDCARSSIPVEYISMPLSGFMAPVTIVGTLIQHTAETLCGITISQLTNPGTPMLYGGAPAVFDMRYETTPMGAVETMMIDCAYIEIGKFLNIPTQTYTAMSDAKLLDAQAGLETGMGATLGALAGANNISGPGMLDFINTLSFEKLVVDNELCGMTFRLLEGIQPREDFPAIPLFEEFLRDKHLIIADHTRKHLKDEIHFPGPTIDRANRDRWQETGAVTIGEKASHEVERLVGATEPTRLEEGVITQLIDRMEAAARTAGMDALPDRSA